MKKKIAVLLAATLLATPQLGLAQESTSNTNKANFEASLSQKSLPSFEITDIKLPSKLEKGQTAEVSFRVKNIGLSGAKDLMIKALPQDKAVLNPKSINQVKAEYYAPNQEEVYTFTFDVSDKTQAKTCPLLIALTYTDEKTGKEQSIEQEVNLKLQEAMEKTASPKEVAMAPSQGGGASDFGPSMDMGPSLPVTPSGGGGTSSSNQGSNVPKIIIDEYSFDPAVVQSGTPFTLNLRIFNTNRDKTIKNIRVSLTADSAESVAPTGGAEGAGAAAMTSAPGSASAFTPVGSSNTFHIESIKPRNHFSKDLVLTTSPDLAPKAYTITANFEYEDSQGTPYQSSEIIGIPVVQKSELTFGDIQLEEEGASVGMALPLSLEFYNTGKSPISNLMVKFRGDFSSDTTTYFVGTMAPGASDSFDANITPEETGKQKGEIVFTYDDAAGIQQEIVKPFAVNVSEEMAMNDEEMQDAAPGGPGWALPLGIGGIAIVGGALGYFVWKKKKNKKDDEDLEV